MEASNLKPHPIDNAVKLVGEAFVPGASLMLDGNILGGGGHLLASFVARAAFGPIGLALVMINSYANSTTGKGLLKQFKSGDADTRTETHTETKTEAKHRPSK